MPNSIVEFQRGEFLISTDPSRLDLNLIHGFLTKVYWAEGIPLETVKRSIENSLCFGIHHQGAQIGFGRAITDYATFAYIGDVFILGKLPGERACEVAGGEHDRPPRTAGPAKMDAGHAGCSWPVFPVRFQRIEFSGKVDGNTQSWCVSTIRGTFSDSQMLPDRCRRRQTKFLRWLRFTRSLISVQDTPSSPRSSDSFPKEDIRGGRSILSAASIPSFR